MNAPLFPISPLLPQIQRHLAAQPRLVLEAPPGAGKTTQVPLALLDAPWLQGRKIILLEPRRVAARSAALFMARQLGEEVGGTVGYRIRFENKVSSRTRIETTACPGASCSTIMPRAAEARSRCIIARFGVVAASVMVDSSSSSRVVAATLR